MSRARLEVGKWGKINTRRLPGKGRKYEASGRVRVKAGTGGVEQVKAVADTEAEAVARFKAEAGSRVSFAVTDALTPDTTVTDLFAAMIVQLRTGTALNPPREQSIDQYETVVDLLRGDYAGGKYPTIGGYPLRQVTKQQVRRWLRDVSTMSPSTGKRCKAAALRAFDLAIDEGVDPWNGNPADRAPLRQAERHHAKALDPADIAVLRRNVAAWQTPRKRTDLLSIVNLLIATGMRPGELLALRWEDVDLVASPATVTVTGTLVELKGKRADGKGLRRQPFGKTHRAYRMLSLPTWAATMLTERMVAASSDLVFPNENGGLLSLRNVGTRWRAARGAEYEGVTLYDFRRTVATMLDRGEGVAAAAAQLGHTSPAITKRHYVERATDAGDHTRVLDLLAPPPA
ncbi:tyrosine-type recombinase/integrase [Corynebacterium variabile]|uniref:tyrosine-type recombinase/integrase n=1 Tax=Corynebacterium variabile TaxID=1727 RepID=UPI003FD4D16C